MEIGYLKELSPVQRSAVEDCTGPSLIIAGAGSGKTRVLTCRIAYLLQQGIPAGQVMALTFTNKAAREMKERIGRLVGDDSAYRLWMGTFHSIFARILRSEAALIGFPPHFTIYDKSDSKSAIKDCIKELQLDDKVYAPNDVQSRISMAKNNLISAASYSADHQVMAADAAARKPLVADIYRLYAQKCRLSGAMDFDDLLLYTNVLFRDFPEVLEKYRARFTHILVDEYQDTNFAQYLIVKKLAQGHRNLCVVGDDAQSIYAFRGARIENILNFKKDFPEASEYRLEQNYRSTQTIVNAANSVIVKNTEQLKKMCFSSAAIGEKIELIKAYTDRDEAYMVVASLLSRQYAARASFSDFAILYRTNAQSRVFEESFRKRNIPYKIYGGFSFYERAEIKDMLAYLRLVVNPRDDEALKRIINVPARGIGDTTLQRLQLAALHNQVSMWEQIEQGNLAEFGLRSAPENKLKEFVRLVKEIAQQQYTTDAYSFAWEVATRSGYLTELKNDLSVEGRARLENVEEFFNSIKEFAGEGAQVESMEEAAEIVTIHSFLTNVALITDLEQADDASEPKVSLMTIHAAKGLEFKHVYIVGMEENLFPSPLSVHSLRDLEEERRLFYVAMTRAKATLALSYAQTRYRWGTQTSNTSSRFLKEIDGCWLNKSIQDEAIPIALEQELMGRKRFTENRFAQDKPTAFPIAPKPLMGAAIRSNPSDPNFMAADPMQLKEGQKIEHEKFGFGEILSIEGSALAERKAVVNFELSGTKTLLLKFAKMKIRYLTIVLMIIGFSSCQRFVMPYTCINLYISSFSQ
jgi:DNA helicase-2/ATP-dependent DNA helicase PcrA